MSKYLLKYLLVVLSLGIFEVDDYCRLCGHYASYEGGGTDAVNSPDIWQFVPDVVCCHVTLETEPLS